MKVNVTKVRAEATVHFDISGSVLAGTIKAGAPKVVSTWFSDEHERRFAVGAYNTAPVLGGMATLVLSNSVFMPLTGSWRLTVAFESAAMLVAVTAWLVVTRRKPPTAAMPAPGDGSDGLRSLLADPRVRTVLVLALGFFFIAHGLAGWLPSVLREHNGFSPMAAANWTAVSGAVGIVTSLTLPRRATRERLPILMAGTLVVVALGLMAVVAAPTFLVPVPMVAIGVRYALIPLTIVTLMDSPAVGPRNMGQAFGLFFAVAEVGGVTGPVIADLDSLPFPDLDLFGAAGMIDSYAQPARDALKCFQAGGLETLQLVHSIQVQV